MKARDIFPVGGSVFFAVLTILFAGCTMHEHRQAEHPAAQEEDVEVRQETLARRARVMRMLSGDNSEARERAALELLAMGDQESLDALKEKLSGPAAPEIKVDILNAIAFRTDHRCFELVLDAFRDPHRKVREAAAAAIAGFTRPENIETVMQYAASAELPPGDLQLLYRAMGDGIFVGATTVLIEGLKSKDPEVKESALDALRRIWDRELPPSPEAWLQLWELNRHRSRAEILEERLKASEMSRQTLRQRIREMEMEMEELSALAMSDERKNPQTLLEAIGSRNLKVMEYAAFTLNRMSKEELKALDLDDRNVYESLRKALVEGTPKVRSYTAGFLKHLEGAYRENLVLDAFQLDPAQVVTEAIAAVGENPTPAVIKNLEGLLRHPNAGVRENAANTLSRSTEESTIAALRYALKDSEANVRWFAVESLRKLGARSAVPDLTELLEHDPSPLVREIAAATLGQMGQPAAFPALRRALRDENRRVREQAARTMAVLAENNPEHVLTVGKALLESGLPADAQRVLENAVQASERDDAPDMTAQITELTMKLADAYSEQGKHAEAALLYSRLINTAGYAGEARGKLHDAYIAGEQSGKLLEDYRQWLQTENESRLLQLLEEGIQVLEKLHLAGKEEAAAILAGILKNSAERLTPLPEEIIGQIEMYLPSGEPEPEEENPEQEPEIIDSDR